MLVAEGLFKNFGDTVALHNVNFSVRPGEFLVVLGPSGSGKTTLLRSMNGLASLDEGNLCFKGKKIGRDLSMHDLRENISMIFQNYNLVENLQVINNVMTGALKKINEFGSLFYYFPNEIKLDALKALQRVQLLDKAYEKTFSLSGGQKQRVGIARALIQNPSVLLADEPIASLDPMIAFKIMTLLKEISINDGISIICNLHQVDFALQFADRIICLVNGEIILDKPAAGLSSEIVHQAYKGKDQGMFFGE
jgi:phosphonate transport system ATP-binding protein